MALKQIGVCLSDDQVSLLHSEISGGDDRVNLQHLFDAIEKRKPKNIGLNSSLDDAWKAILEVAGAGNSSLWSRSLPSLFRLFDKDGSGNIDVAELASGLKSLGVKLTPDQVMALRDDLDCNHDGTISKNEFEESISRKLEAFAINFVNDAFQITEEAVFANVDPIKEQQSTESIPIEVIQFSLQFSLLNTDSFDSEKKVWIFSQLIEIQILCI